MELLAAELKDESQGTNSSEKNSRKKQRYRASILLALFIILLLEIAKAINSYFVTLK